MSTSPSSTSSSMSTLKLLHLHLGNRKIPHSLVRQVVNEGKYNTMEKRDSHLRTTRREGYKDNRC